MRFAIFPFHLSKVLRLPGKSGAKSHEVLHLSRKIILANLKIGCSKMQPLSGNQRPDPLTSLIKKNVSCTAPATRNGLCRSSSNIPRPLSFWTCYKTLTFDHLWQSSAESFTPAPQKRCFNVQKWREHVVFWHFDFGLCFTPQGRALFQHLVVRDSQFLTLWTLKCASRQDGVHFFNISTSKSGPRQSVFNTLDFEMCFTPGQRALSQHLNFQKWSETVSF